jgi:predicted NBD/HSP70 family sugar kinase
MTLASHGALLLPAVAIESYNVELKDDEGFLGDRACKGAFRDFVEEWRRPLRELGHDPFGDDPSEELSKRQFDKLLRDGDPEAAGIVQGAIESFAQELALVVGQFLKLKAWKGVQGIVVGGGFSGCRVGELCIGRASVILKAQKIKAAISTIRHEPDEAGLIGAAHLAPVWMFQAHNAIIGVDIGGTNIRAGVIELNLKKARDLSKAKVWKYELWRHGDEQLNRDDAVHGLIDMLNRLIHQADAEGLKLAPFIGLGCPGKIEPDGSIDRGAQNLPGNWESSRFNLSHEIRKAIPMVGGFETEVVMHNDAVVQGLSQIPFMRDVERWAIFTIGTGLGNALFHNRKPE